MTVEKINDNQIKATIDDSDFNRYNCTIKDLAYGSVKTKAMFKEILETASAELGFEAGNYPLMIEAIPMSEKLIQVIITRVDDPDELDTRFSKFTPEYDAEDEDISPAKGNGDDIIALFKKFKELADKLEEGADSSKGSNVTANKESQPEHKLTLKMLAYTFTKLDDLINVAHNVDSMGLKNSLYKEEDGPYYLLMDESSIDEKCSHLFSVLKEYADKELVSPTLKSYLSEHCKLVMKNNALEMLGKL